MPEAISEMNPKDRLVQWMEQGLEVRGMIYRGVWRITLCQMSTDLHQHFEGAGTSFEQAVARAQLALWRATMAAQAHNN